MDERKNNGEAPARMKLRVLTPKGAALETEGGSVTLPLADDTNGRGGGSVGVRARHIKTVMALSDGDIRVDGRVRARIRAGVAYVENNTATVVTEEAEIE